MLLLNRDIINCIYFLFHNMAFGLIVSLMPAVNKKKILLFTVLTTATTLFCKYIFSISNIELFKLLNTMILLMNCVSILKLDNFDSLVITATYALINFIVNFVSLSLNLSIFSDFYVLCQTLLFTLIIAISYKCFYNSQIKSLIQKIKNYFFEDLEVYLMLLILALSYDFSAMQNEKTAFIALLYQLIMIICISLIIKNKIEIKIMNANIRKLILENEKSKQLVDDIRIFKHDYSNTLCSIGGYISLNDMNGLKKFYSKLTDGLSNSNNLQKINTISINEPSIYNLLASKYKTILKNNLKFDFYSTINYKKLCVSPYELSRILGIFLDNAIEASSISKEKELLISCETLKNKKHQIIIKNSYTNKDVDIDKIFLKGYSSKKIKSGLRFMGS